MGRQLQTYSLLVWLCLFSSAFSQSRYKVAVQLVGGLYAVNSENDLPLLQDGKFIGGYGVSATVASIRKSGYSPAFDFQYFRSNANGRLMFNQSLAGAQTVRTFYGTIALDQFCVDVGLRHPLNGCLQVGMGPSLALDSRAVDVPYEDVADRLNSYCLGLHISAETSEPFQKGTDKGFFWYYTLKVRYLHSILFDARGRDLSNYAQSFLTASLGAGIGYSF